MRSKFTSAWCFDEDSSDFPFPYSSGQNSLAELQQKLTLLTTQQAQETQNQVRHGNINRRALALTNSPFQPSHEGIQLDLSKQYLQTSGVNSPSTVSSPSCEPRNELTFPSLPPAGQQQQTQSQEPSKATPKISQLSELDQQLSKLHNQRTVLQQQQQQQQTYSDAVRQSPTTVQQQFVQPNASQQVQAPSQSAPVNPVQTNQANNLVVAPVPKPERKLSRFVISKVNEESKAQPQPQQNQNQPQPKSAVNSSENDQTNIQQMQSPNGAQPVMPGQQNQAQLFFQKHHGGVVSTLCAFRLSRIRLSLLKGAREFCLL